MAAATERDGVDSETAFAILMIVLSVCIFLAVRNSETSSSGVAPTAVAGTLFRNAHSGRS
jgi:hypothetical protein